MGLRRIMYGIKYVCGIRRLTEEDRRSKVVSIAYL